MILTAGTKLGPYEIAASLGAGGMGEVYRAKDTRLGRSVAIKVLTARAVNDPVRRERFDREARVVATLNHPHICTLYDIGNQDGLDFLIMERVEGQTLQNRLLRGPLAVDDALRHAIEIAGALDHAHRHGIVHRDLKPANVMLTKTGAKLLDFGLAKLRMPETIARSLSAETGSLTAEGGHLRHAGVHGPRNARGPGGGRPDGSLRIWRARLRDAERTPAVRGGQRRKHHRCGHGTRQVSSEWSGRSPSRRERPRQSISGSSPAR